MRILVISDSHGSKNNIFDAIDLESPDLILHLGDNDRDCNDAGLLYPAIPLRTVRGNCDRGSPGLDMDEFVLEGKRFFMTHGHLFGVKMGRTNIKKAAIDRGIDVLLFGHTHIPHYSVFEGLIIVNPGNIGEGGNNYAVLEISNGAVSCELKVL